MLLSDGSRAAPIYYVVAAGVADGVKGTVVDYVPVYASPCGMGFAYWEMPA